jgi:hypothetical protein
MAIGTNRRLDITEFDFDDIKSNLKTFLKGQQQFKDYDFEGAGINVLLDTLAYNTHYLGFNLNMVANEMFMDSSTLRSSIVSHAKSLGYETQSARASYAEVNIVLNDSSRATAVMPSGTKFTTKLDNTNYQYVTVEDMTAQSTGVEIPFNNVRIYEGTYITTRYTKDSTDLDQRFLINDNAADTTTLTVKVMNSDTDSITNTYIKATDITQLTGQSYVYFLQEVEGGRGEVYFGDGVVSKSITDGNVVILEYVVSNKGAANGAKDFTSAGAIDTVTDITVTTIAKSLGGNESESLASIKLNAPLDFASQGRCVTTEDYKMYARKLFPQTQAVMVFGGEAGSFDPSLGVTSTASYGRVYISIKSTTGNNLTTSQKYDLVKALGKYNVASITPIIIDPDITYLILNTIFKYDSSKTTKEKSGLQTAVSTRLSQYNNEELKSFNNIFRFSGVSSLIDNVDDSILSNTTTVTLAKYIQPERNLKRGYFTYFNNPIHNPHPTHNQENGGVMTSSGFYVDGDTENEIFFDDDGEGNIRSYYVSGITRLYTNRNAGTVNYKTGAVSINSINITKLSKVDGLDSLKIRITALPDSKDIVPVRNQILELDMVNLQITGEIDTVAVGDAGASSTYKTTPSAPDNKSY